MDPKATARARLERFEGDLIELSERIHASPELGFQEERACGWLAGLLGNAGLSVETGICDLPTAFVARAGHGSLHVAICAEYDCLPGIGHACGHNIIAAAAAGAGIAAAAVAEQLDLTVSVVGTPAEEVGNASGKILLLERGVFDGVHAAMMVHPGPLDVAEPLMLAVATFDVHYKGVEAHASAFPERGVNAADAITVAQTAIGLLRQHIRPGERIHGIVTHGGEAPNVVPGRTAARYMARAKTLEELGGLLARVHACFEAGALATGAELEITGGDKPYAHMLHDKEMADLYRHNAERLGRSFPDLGALKSAAGSTDMANLSLVVPAIHPIIGIQSSRALPHQPEFAAHCVGESAGRAVRDGALALAWTAIDLATDTSVRRRLLQPSNEQ